MTDPVLFAVAEKTPLDDLVTLFERVDEVDIDASPDCVAGRLN